MKKGKIILGIIKG